MAALLSWARSGGASVSRTVFLDAQGVASGELESGWLQQSYNGSNGVWPFAVRWRVSTAAWVGGLIPDFKVRELLRTDEYQCESLINV